MGARIPRFVSLALCGVSFAALHLLVNLYQAFYHNAALPWVAVSTGAAVVCAMGALGYLAGSLILARDFRPATISLIAVFGYFVSYSITTLLGSIIASPWVFVIIVLVVTAFITVKIGPRWDRGAT